MAREFSYRTETLFKATCWCFRRHIDPKNIKLTSKKFGKRIDASRSYRSRKSQGTLSQEAVSQGTRIQARGWGKSFVRFPGESVLSELETRGRDLSTNVSRVSRRTRRELPRGFLLLFISSASSVLYRQGSLGVALSLLSSFLRLFIFFPSRVCHSCKRRFRMKENLLNGKMSYSCIVSELDGFYLLSKRNSKVILKILHLIEWIWNRIIYADMEGNFVD